MAAASQTLASLLTAVRPLALPARLLALAQAFLPAGLLLALLATLETGADGPFTGAPRTALAVLLLAGWTCAARPPRRPRRAPKRSGRERGL
jgi:hypothetical protein